MTTWLTSTYNFSDALADAFGAAFSFVLILQGLGLLILVGIVALITWVVKKVWYAGSDKEDRRRSKAQKQWLNHQDRSEWEEYRSRGTSRHFDYAPGDPVATERNGEIYSPTGWKWDEESNTWLPPKSLVEESHKRWKWDPVKGIWIDQFKK